jgi:hypothetical protein
MDTMRMTNVTPQQIRIVQESFNKVAPIAEVAADLFYARLFELDPSLRPMFKTDMKRQGMTLMTMLGSAVRGLANPQALVPVLRGLGRPPCLLRRQGIALRNRGPGVPRHARARLRQGFRR